MGFLDLKLWFVWRYLLADVNCFALWKLMILMRFGMKMGKVLEQIFSKYSLELMYNFVAQSVLIFVVYKSCFRKSYIRLSFCCLYTVIWKLQSSYLWFKMKLCLSGADLWTTNGFCWAEGVIRWQKLLSLWLCADTFTKFYAIFCIQKTRESSQKYSQAFFKAIGTAFTLSDGYSHI